MTLRAQSDEARRLAGVACLALSMSCLQAQNTTARQPLPDPLNAKREAAFLKLLDIQPTEIAEGLPLPAGAYRIADGVVGPAAIRRADPAFPDQDRRIGLEGTALVAAVIGRDGLASGIKVTRPLGFGLDEEAVKAVSGWRFKPGTYWGHPLPTFATFAVDFRMPSDPSRWHFTGIRFKPAAGATSPVLKVTALPGGAGISRDALDEGQLVMAMGRLGNATLSFDVNADGTPANFQIERASLPLWGNEAIGVVKKWLFQPALLRGKPAPATAEVDLVWGPRDLPRVDRNGVPVTLAPISANFSCPPVVSRVEPSYSAEALTRKVEGTVVVSMIVGEDGVPRNVAAEKPLGFGLDQQATDAVSKWRFSPVVREGRTEAVPATVSVAFRLPK